MQEVVVKRQSWCGARSAMIVMAFSMVLEPRDIPTKEILRLHEDLTLTMPALETRLVALSREYGFTLRFK